MTLSDWLGVAGLVLTVIGFAVTLVQLARTKKAAKAATDALKSAVSRMSANHLLVLLPQFRLIEVDLDTASSQDDKTLAIRTLVTFSHMANQVASLLSTYSGTSEELFIADLRQSALISTSAKAQLVSGTTRPVKTVVKAASEQINSISVAAAGIATTYQTEVGQQ